MPYFSEQTIVGGFERRAGVFMAPSTAHGADRFASAATLLLAAGAVTAGAIYFAPVALGAAAYGAHRRRRGDHFAHPRRGRAVSREDWHAAQDRDGRVSDAAASELRAKVMNGGVEPAVRAEAWPMLLGTRATASTATELEQSRRRRREAYRALVSRVDALSEMLRGASVGRRRSMDGPPPDELGVFTESDRVIAADVPRTPMDASSAFATACAADAEDAAAEDDRRAAAAAAADPESDSFIRREYDSSAPSTSESDVDAWRVAQSSRLRELLRAFALYDEAVGYCQGMNEIACVFLDNITDASEAFWCFVEFIRGPYRSHFIIHKTGGGSGATSGRAEGIRDRLILIGKIIAASDAALWRHLKALGGGDCIFAFRACVVLMLRELPKEEAVYVWEALMASGDHVGGGGGGGGGNRDGGGGGGDDVPGSLLLRVLAAFFLQSRSALMGCKTYDDLLLVSQRLGSGGKVSASALLAAAAKLKIPPR